MKRSRTFPAVGDDVSVTFMDHCQDGENTVLCTVRGEIVRVNTEDISVESWTTHDENIPENRTRFSIVRSTIRKIVIKQEASVYEPAQKKDRIKSHKSSRSNGRRRKRTKK